MEISRICGHVDNLYFATQEAYLLEQQNYNCLCLSCRNKYQLTKPKVDFADKEALTPLNTDWSLPQPGDLYRINNQAELVQLIRNFSGNYGLQYFPDRGIPYQTWIRDQPEVERFLNERSAVRIDRIM